MIYRGAGFFALVRFGSSPTPNSPSLSRQQALPATQRNAEKERQLAGKIVGVGGRGAKAYDRKKAWSSINHETHGIPSQSVSIKVY